MTSSMTIGDFAQATRLSAKALRFYHAAGLLEPASVDPSNGYRLYDATQIADAQVIRQLRALEVPVDTIREILAASDVTARNELVAAHLSRLEAQLDTTRAAVSTLKGLLTEPAVDLPIAHRSEPPTPALVIRATIDLAELGPWYTGAVRELDEASRHRGVRAVGPVGGTWATELFLDERGGAALFQSVESLDGLPPFDGRVVPETLPAVDLAIAVHHGRDEAIARTYGALGAYVAEHEIGIPGPVRERYLRLPTAETPELVTEIGWPIFRATR